jgi:hypothetical protein
MRRKILKVKQIGLTKESGKANAEVSGQNCRVLIALVKPLQKLKTAFCFSLQIEQVREKVCN